MYSTRNLFLFWILANEGTSLIGLWMLQPSILELMAIKLFAASEHVPPSVQYAHIYLLYSHCSKYSHFVTSSGLLIAQGRLNVSEMLGLSSAACDGISTISPTTGHLSIILTVLGKYVVSVSSFKGCIDHGSWHNVARSKYCYGEGNISRRHPSLLNDVPLKKYTKSATLSLSSMGNYRSKKIQEYLWDLKILHSSKMEELKTTKQSHGKRNW